ncbi:MAG: archease [Nanoarchaeota archaeon]
MKAGFEFIEHMADIKFRAYGKSLNEAFENAALAVSNYISRGKKIKALKKRKIDICGRDDKSLLYNFLDELVYLLDAENFVIAKAKIRIKGNKLSGEIFGDDAGDYEGLDCIKSATYAEMYIKKLKSRLWEIQVVMDV